MKKKILLIRLSSLGDVILSSEILDLFSSDAHEIHWLCFSPYRTLLQNHPKIFKVHSIDRKNLNLKKWRSFLQGISTENFDEVWDLHANFRSVFARTFFKFTNNKPKIRAFSKPRFRRFLYILLKSALPKSLRIKPWGEYLKETAVKKYPSSLSHRHLVAPKLWTHFQAPREKIPEPLRDRAYGVLIPSSAWPGKEWPAESFLEFAQYKKKLNSDWTPVLFGMPGDKNAHKVRDLLRSHGIQTQAFFQGSSWEELATLLQHAESVLSGDTGLAHFAEKVGARPFVLYGPTTGEFGFGIHEVSHRIESKIWCRPCSKDGSACFRLGKDRYRCMKKITPHQVSERMYEKR